MIAKSDILRTLKLFEYLPNSPVKDNPERLTALVDSYFQALKDLPIDMLNAAASAYLATGQFFPTPGNLRERAVDIALLSMGIPTPGEAWGQVNGGKGILHSVRCPIGEGLRRGVDGLIGNEYWAALARYDQHVYTCDDCYDDRADGWHPTVKAAFEAMGGDHGVFTDNLSADRARFSDGYRAFVEREVLRFSMPADVRSYIASNQARLTDGPVKQLTAKLSTRGERLE